MFPIFNEGCSCFNKAKGGVMGDTLCPQTLHPIKVTLPCSTIILTAANDLLDLAVTKIFFYADRTDKRRHMIPLCLNGNLSKMGIRSSALCWFSQVTLKKIFSHPSPQSFGRHFSTRCGRFVSRKNFTSGRLRIIPLPRFATDPPPLKRSQRTCTPGSVHCCELYIRHF